MKVMVTTGAISRAKLQSNHHHQQTNIIFYRPDALSVAQLTVSKHWREKYHIPLTCLPQAHQLCLWPLTAPGYLGEGCHASHQPSDAPILHWKHWFSSRFNCLIKKTMRIINHNMYNRETYWNECCIHMNSTRCPFCVEDGPQLKCRTCNCRLLTMKAARCYTQ